MFKHYAVSLIGLLVGLALLGQSDWYWRQQALLPAVALTGAGALAILWAGRRLWKRLARHTRPRPLD